MVKFFRNRQPCAFQRKIHKNSEYFLEYFCFTGKFEQKLSDKKWIFYRNRQPCGFWLNILKNKTQKSFEYSLLEDTSKKIKINVNRAVFKRKKHNFSWIFFEYLFPKYSTVSKNEYLNKRQPCGCSHCEQAPNGVSVGHSLSCYLIFGQNIQQIRTRKLSRKQIFLDLDKEPKWLFFPLTKL